MPKQPKLPPRDAFGKFVKKVPSTSQLSFDPLLDPSIREPEPSSSTSTLPDSIDSSSSDLSSTPRLSLIFPKPIRHSIPGSFSPLADSPSESSVPLSTLVSHSTKLFASPSKSPSSTLVPIIRTPSPASPSRPFIPRTPSAPPRLPSDSSSSSSSSSASSSRTISLAPQVSSSIFSVNFRASQFLSSRPDPPVTQTLPIADPSSSSQTPSLSIPAPLPLS